MKPKMAAESSPTSTVVKPKGPFEAVGEFRCILIMSLGGYKRLSVQT